MNDKQIKQTVEGLLGVLAATDIEAQSRVNAAGVLAEIYDTTKRWKAFEGVKEVAKSSGDNAKTVLDAVNKLNKRDKKPWEDEEE